MNHSTHFTITVPMRDNAGNAAPEATKMVEAALVKYAGGYTATIVQGAWANDAGETIRDDSTRFDVFIESTPPPSASWQFQHELRKIARGLCVTLDQECVLITRLDRRGFFTEFVRG